MSGERAHRRWQISLKSLMLGIALLSVLLAATLPRGRPRVMFRLRDADAGATVYATHCGWPIPYLTVPTGDHAGKVPADLFVPGLIVDLALAAIVCVAVLKLSAILSRAGSSGDRQALATESTTPKTPRFATRRLALIAVGVLVLFVVGMAAVRVAIELGE